MESSERIRISPDFIFTKIVLAVGLFISLLLLQDYNRVNLKDAAGNVLLIIITATGLVYFFTRPAIFYDDDNLYIKKINKAEVLIPLQDVKSIEKDFFTSIFTKGGNYYCIKFFNNNKEEKIKFYIDYFRLSALKEFIAFIKKTIPSIKIDD